MRNHLCLIILFFLAIPFASRGQSTYVFHHFSTNDGLLNNEVKSVIRDKYGFLWIGTVSGLNRYDGCRLKSYVSSPDNPFSLPEDDIISLQEDDGGNIWVGGRNSYVIYKREKDCFVDAKPMLQQLHIPIELLLQVYVDCSGNLWVLSGNSLFYYQYANGLLKQYALQMASGIEGMTDDGENLFLMDQDGFLFQLNKRQGVWKQIVIPKVSGLNRVYCDKSQGLWLFSTQDDALFYQVEKEGNWKRITLNSTERTQSNFIHSIQDDGEGKIWIATDHKGLFIYDKQKGSQINILHNPLLNSSIVENNVGCIYQDKSGALWIGYGKKGLSCYHNSFQRFLNFQSSTYRNISAVLEDRDGNIWLGTDGYGLVCKRPMSDDIIHKVDIPGNIVVTLLEDNKGRIWIGTYLHGLLCYDHGKLKQYTTSNSGLSDNSIWILRQDKTGALWVGSLWGCLQRMNPETENFENFAAKSKDESIAISMYYDGAEELYVGMISGVCKINVISGEKQTFQGNRKGEQRFQQSFIQSIYRDKRGILWLGHNQGITAWDMERDVLYYINRRDGLCDNVIRGIAEDDRNRIWITTSNGCSVVTVLREADGSLSFQLDNYSTKDGMPDNNFSRHSLCKLQGDYMLLGSVDGYSLANLSLLNEKNAQLAKVTFTGLQIAGKEIEVDSTYNGHVLLTHPIDQQDVLHLSYADRLISLEYTVMDLIASDKIRYAYRLEGINREWAYTSDNKITFTSLAPGDYRLWVKACNSDGIWNDEATVLNIEVAPPFWRSWYAYILYIVLAVGIVWLWLRQLQKKHKQKLVQQRLELEHEQAIRLNEMKLRFFTNVSHDFRTPLTLIITPLQVIIENIKEENIHKKLKAVYRNAEQLLNLVNQLLDFRKLDVGAETLRPKKGDIVSFIKETATAFNIYASDRQMSFSIIDEVRELQMSFDADKIRKIVTNLLSNAFKYTSDGGDIKVCIFHNGDSVAVSVSDTGIGISDEDKKNIFERFYQTQQNQDKTGSGIGLHIVSEYVRLHQGNIDVSDNQPKGSIFTFTIPIIESEKEDELPEAHEERMEEETIVASVEQESPTILLVEDNKDFCDFMSETLSDEFRVLVAGNGREAMECLEQENVNIVVSDIMMPIMDGLELCKHIKTDIRLSHIPVILLTARTAEEYQLQGLELGADDYITKPFNFNMLRLRIHKFIEWTERCHRVFSHKMDVSPSEITITPLDEQLIAKAIKIVEEHIDNSEFSVENLSEEVGLTRGHLYKKLMSITGKGPADFIRTIRLKRAKQLLEESQLQIAEIAYSVGFSSPKIFSRNFKQEYGILPSEYVKAKK